MLEAARTLDYVPNALARGMLERQVPVVGVIVHDITDPYFAEVVRGVEDAASRRGFLVITCSSERDGDREREYVRLLRSMRAAVVIFAGSGLDDPSAQRRTWSGTSTAMRAEVGAAVVHLSPHAGGEPGGRRRQRRRASRRWSRRWSALGHERIAFLAGPSALFVARDRLAGYRRGLAEAGLAVDERLIVRTSFDREGGVLGVDTLLAGDAPFTAIAAPTTCSRWVRWRGSQELGIARPGRRVGRRASTTSRSRRITAPALSTVRMPLRELGRRGFAAVARVLDGDRRRPEEPAHRGRPPRVDRRRARHALPLRPRHTGGTA